MPPREKERAGYPVHWSAGHMILLVVLRTAVGWHFLYEGVVKLADRQWSSADYLAESKWLLADFFHWIASHSAALKTVDFINIWALILIGLALLSGLFTRLASVGGIFLLILYYLANPALIGQAKAAMAEGHYLLIDKNLVELAALLLLAGFPSGRFLGLDRLLYRRRSRKTAPPPATAEQAVLAVAVAEPGPPGAMSRGDLLKSLATLPVLGLFVYAYLKKRGWENVEEKNLQAARDYDLNAVTSATVKTFHFASLKELKGTPPCGRIGQLQISRLFLGGNLIGGWAHARDLIYVSKLIRAYHTDQKIFETLHLAERCGINTIMTNPRLCRVVNEYWRKEKGKIQFISDCGYNGDMMQGAKVSIEAGARACYVQGKIADRLVRAGKCAELAKFLDYVRRNGLPAGLGAHELETVQACVDLGLKPDFWVKTLHHLNYWSSSTQNQKDNVWCVNPEQTIAYMNKLEQPWIAFKVLAAGAIKPEDGFAHAFKNGADFICVGMYDFQIVEDVNIALEVLGGKLERPYPWRA